MGKRIWKAGIEAVILVLALFTIFVIYTGLKQERQQKIKVSEVQNKVKPYEAEIEEINRDLARKATELSDTPNNGKVMIGYCLASDNGLSIVEKHMQEYDFQPVLMLDCTEKIEDLEGVLTDIQEKSIEIMLTGTPFTDSVLNTADNIKRILKSDYLDSNVSFLLRGPDDTPENLEKLSEHGYSGLARYSNSVNSGMTDEDIPYIAYSFINSSEQTLGGISQVIQNKSAMIMIFDLTSVESEGGGYHCIFGLYSGKSQSGTADILFGGRSIRRN